jgi:hypothetical protein
MLGEIFDTDNYFYTTLLLMYYVRVPFPLQREIAGIFAGMREALGEAGLYSAKLSRDFMPIDLIRFNMVEIFPLEFESRTLCSSASAWDNGTADGSPMMVRNLDFGSPGDLAEKNSIIIVYKHRRGLLAPRRWISFAWPGFVGCLTGMNEKGVTAAVQYANTNPSVEDLMIQIPRVYTPLSFVVRRGLESRSRGMRKNPIGSMFRRLLITPVAGSYNLHMIAPDAVQRGPTAEEAAVIEGNNIWTGFRTYRYNSMDEPRLNADCFLAATNHHRKIIPPVECPRYETIVDALNSLSKLDMQAGFSILRSVAQDEGPMHTVQMIGISAASRELMISFGGDERSAYEKEPVPLTWNDLF